MMNVKKIAVWGLGKHAINRILPAIKEVNGLELVGVCSRNETVVREYSKKLDCCGWTNPEDMLKKEGPGSFFKGIVPKLSSIGPKLTFSFTIAQYLIDYFNVMLKKQ